MKNKQFLGNYTRLKKRLDAEVVTPKMVVKQSGPPYTVERMGMIMGFTTKHKYNL